MKLNQKEKVMRHLNNYGSITPLDAFRDYGIMRLAAVIFNLKEGQSSSSAFLLHRILSPQLRISIYK